MLREFDYGRFLEEAGIQKGDLLDVSSDMMHVRLMCSRAGCFFEPDHLLEALQEAVGPEGTIMVRAFTWDFCRGEPFDIRSSKSRVGVLGDIARERPDFSRTKHPLYSWVVWGKCRETLCALENRNSFGSGTPFAFLAEHTGKQLRIGQTQTPGYTQMHHLEKLADVPYRYEKYFDGSYTDAEGKTTTRRYTMFVRRLDVDARVRDGWKWMEQDWREAGALREGCCDGQVSWGILKLREAGDMVYRDLMENYGRKSFLINGKPGFKGMERTGRYENEYREER